MPYVWYKSIPLKAHRKHFEKRLKILQKVIPLVRLSSLLCPPHSGANTGIGKATAMNLARRRARVIMACRDRQRAEAAIQEIIQVKCRKRGRRKLWADATHFPQTRLITTMSFLFLFLLSSSSFFFFSVFANRRQETSRWSSCSSIWPVWSLCAPSPRASCSPSPGWICWSTTLVSPTTQLNESKFKDAS